MNYTNTKQVKETFENLINTGRTSRKEPLMKLGAMTTPSNVLDRMTDNDFKALDILGSYKGISANSYVAKMSMLWSSIFWKIGEQILIIGNYVTPFQKYYKECPVGGDIEEQALRIKNPIDRTTLANSAILTNYVTQRDNFLHRFKNFNVFSATYNQAEIINISSTWDNIANSINAELENIIKSASIYLNDLAISSFSNQYLSGGMDEVTITPITNQSTAEDVAVTINTLIDRMRISATTEFIPFNRNANNPSHDIKDIAVSDMLLVCTPDLYNNVNFRTALSTYFGGKFNNDKYAFNVILVDSFNTAIDNKTNVTPGYTALANPKKLKAVLIEEEGLIYRIREHGTYNFDNTATLNTSIFKHIDVLADISDRRKCVAIVE